MENNSDDVAYEFFPFLRVYKDGRIERLILTSRVPPGVDPKTGAQSKDVIISSDTNLSARIFIPKMETPKKLPLIIHFHGGGFCTGSAFCPITKYSMTNFAGTSKVITVSIDYRLAPEYPLPIAYDDAWDALQWIAQHVKGTGPESWLNQYANFERTYIGGEGAGGNIAHDVMLKASENVDMIQGLNIIGLTVVHPYFGCQEPDRLYKYLCPSSCGTDKDPRLNPGIDSRLSRLMCKKVMVCVAEMDRLKGRGVAYYQSLQNSGWQGKIELVESKGKGHCFFMLNPAECCEPFLTKLSSFVLEDD